MSPFQDFYAELRCGTPDCGRTPNLLMIPSVLVCTHTGEGPSAAGHVG
jgi:hypothetical protein